MSILPLRFGFRMAMNYLKLPIDVTDTLYTPTNGIDYQSVDNYRTISGVVTVDNAQQLENMFGGNVSDGDISVATTEDLYIGDQVDYSSGEIQRQSYVTWNGLYYRIVGCLPFSQHGGFKVYHAKRHVRQDVV